MQFRSSFEHHFKIIGQAAVLDAVNPWDLSLLGSCRQLCMQLPGYSEGSGWAHFIQDGVLSWMGDAEVQKKE